MKKKRAEKPYTRPLIIIGVMFLIAGIFLSLYLLKIENVRVEGNHYVTDELIRGAVFPDGEKKTLLNVLLMRFFGKDKSAGLASVKVSPASLTGCVIRVKEERAVCQIHDGTLYNVMTQDGTVLTRLSEPDESLMELKGVQVKSASILSKLSSHDDEAMMTGLLYASRFIESDVPVSYLTVSKDGCNAQVDGVTILLGNSFGATEKVDEVSAQYPVYKGLNGTLHMEEFYLESGNVRIYFEVGDEMMTQKEETETGSPEN